MPDTAEMFYIYHLIDFLNNAVSSVIINISQIRKLRHSKDGNLPVSPSPTLQKKKKKEKSVNGGTRI